MFSRMSWAKAVKEWNSVQFFKEDLYGIPRKGGIYYDDVKEIMERSKHKKDVEKMMGKEPVKIETIQPKISQISGAEMAAYDNARIMKKGNWREVMNYYENKYPFLKQKETTEEKIVEQKKETLELKPLEFTRELQRILFQYDQKQKEEELYKKDKTQKWYAKSGEEKMDIYDAYLLYAKKKNIPIHQTKPLFEITLKAYLEAIKAQYAMRKEQREKAYTEKMMVKKEKIR